MAHEVLSHKKAISLTDCIHCVRSDETDMDFYNTTHSLYQGQITIAVEQICYYSLPSINEKKW